ncbi:FHA domain-containing protein [Toxoplasma gondii RUB]|uniref:E3 ubiquitin-protein ligase CHFR n=1 Tax=Toxoplasma gondii RUB TaxID=935652 RepID=A0A086LYU8_TOXGO|nr:FHA domain-containing protein [Toxoplasma gondii RUB]
MGENMAPKGCDRRAAACTGRQEVGTREAHPPLSANGDGGRRWHARRRTHAREEAKEQAAAAAVATAAPAVFAGGSVGEKGADSSCHACEASGARWTDGSASVGSRETGIDKPRSGPNEGGNKVLERQEGEHSDAGRARVCEATASWTKVRDARTTQAEGRRCTGVSGQSSCEASTKKREDKEPGTGATTARGLMKSSNAARVTLNERGGKTATATGGRPYSPSALSGPSCEPRTLSSVSSVPPPTSDCTHSHITHVSSPLGPSSSSSSPLPGARKPTACGHLGSHSPAGSPAGCFRLASSSSCDVPLSPSSQPFFGVSSSSASAFSSELPSSAPASDSPCPATEACRQPGQPQEGGQAPPVSLTSSGPLTSLSSFGLAAAPSSPSGSAAGPRGGRAATSSFSVCSSSSSTSAGEEPPLLASLRKELTCSICLELLQLPVTINCGHTFCRYCISHNKMSRRSCPLCRQPLSLSSLSINTVLANLLTLLGVRRGKKGGFSAVALLAKGPGAPQGQLEPNASTASRETHDAGAGSSLAAEGSPRPETRRETADVCLTSPNLMRSRLEIAKQRERTSASLSLVDDQDKAPSNPKETEATEPAQALSLPSAAAGTPTPGSPPVAGSTADGRTETPVSTRPPTAAWWAESFVKPKLAMPLVLRLLLRDLGEDSVIFFDDLVGCVVEEFEKRSLWSAEKWLFTLQDLETFAQIVRFDRDDRQTSLERIRSWVEDYVTAAPSVCCRRFITDPVSGCHGRIVMRVLADPQHKIESRVVDSADIRHSLPWDLGRHHQSLIHIPHSSVSLSHLQLLRQPTADSDQLAVLDLGSTIGTMLLIDGTHALQSGDVIHIGDRIEIAVDVVPARLFRRLERRRQRQRTVNREAGRHDSGLAPPTELALSGREDGEGDTCRRQVYRGQLRFDRGWISSSGRAVPDRCPHEELCECSGSSGSDKVFGARGVSRGSEARGIDIPGDAVECGSERLGLEQGLPLCSPYSSFFEARSKKTLTKNRDKRREERASRRAARRQWQRPGKTPGTRSGTKTSDWGRDGEREDANAENRRLLKLLDIVPPNPFLDMQWNRPRRECQRVQPLPVEAPLSRRSPHRHGARETEHGCLGAESCSQIQRRSHSYLPVSREDARLLPWVTAPPRQGDMTVCRLPSTSPSHGSSPVCAASHFTASSPPASPEEPLSSCVPFLLRPGSQGEDTEKEAPATSVVHQELAGFPAGGAEKRDASEDAGSVPGSWGAQTQSRLDASPSIASASFSSHPPRRPLPEEGLYRPDASERSAGWGEGEQETAETQSGSDRREGEEEPTIAPALNQPEGTARALSGPGGTSVPVVALPRLPLSCAGMPQHFERFRSSSDAEHGAASDIASSHCARLSSTRNHFSGSHCLAPKRGDAAAHGDGEATGRTERTLQKGTRGKGGEARDFFSSRGPAEADLSLPVLFRSPSAPLAGASVVYEGTADTCHLSSPRREVHRSSLPLPCLSRDLTQNEDCDDWLDSEESEADLSYESSHDGCSDLVDSGETEPLDSFLLLRITDGSTGATGPAASHPPSASPGGEDAGERTRNETSLQAEGDGDSVKEERKTSKVLSLLPPGYCEWAPPTGVVLGRGPHNPLRDFKKIAVTANNGYISRVHCLIYYDGSRPRHQRWVLKDASTLGTYLRLKPFEPHPCPLTPKCILKVGQCKVEISLRGAASPCPVPSPINGAVSIRTLSPRSRGAHLVSLSSLSNSPASLTPSAGCSTIPPPSSSAPPRSRILPSSRTLPPCIPAPPSSADRPFAGSSHEGTSFTFSSNPLSHAGSASDGQVASPQHQFASHFRLAPLLGPTSQEDADSSDPRRTEKASAPSSSCGRGAGSHAQMSKGVPASAPPSLTASGPPVFAGASFATRWALSRSSSVELFPSHLGVGSRGQWTGPSPPSSRPVTPSSSLTLLPSGQHLPRESEFASSQSCQPLSSACQNTGPLPVVSSSASVVPHSSAGPGFQANTHGAQSQFYARDQESGGGPFPLELPSSPVSSGGLRVLTIASSAGCSSSAFTPH